MIITDYYKMQEIKPLKSHRFDCIASTGEYDPFEVIAQKSRDKRFFFYYNGVPDSFSLNAQRKAERVISNKNNISSVYIPDIHTPLKGWGDVVGTKDAILFLFSEDYKEVEVFIARGYKNDARALFNLFSDGELDREIEIIRARAVLVK